MIEDIQGDLNVIDYKWKYMFNLRTLPKDVWASLKKTSVSGVAGGKNCGQ